jgi:S1-C subfamily serine protease
LGEMELVSLTPQLGRYFGTDKGVLVVRAPKDFKLEDGDVILAIDGREPTSGSHATRILGSYQPGEKIAIKLMRQQKTVNVETTLPERGSRMESGRTGPDGRVRMTHRESDGST